METFSISSARSYVRVDRDTSERNRYLEGDELRHAKEGSADINIEGVVYSATHLGFKSLSDHELLNEKIETSVKASGSESVVAFYSPFQKDEVITMTLDNKTLQGLKDKFGDKDFFERKDGIVRLNDEAQDYVMNWYYEIGYKRGYLRADKDNNGIIEGSEQGHLKVGFERLYDYGYVGEKVTESNLSMSGKAYQSYADTTDFRNQQSGQSQSSLLYRQSLDFGDTIEKELRHTLKTDRDLDGKITLKEGLLEEAGDGEEKLREKIAAEANRLHQNYLKSIGTPPEKNKLLHRVADGGLIQEAADSILPFSSNAPQSNEPKIGISNVDFGKLRFLNGQKISEVDPSSLRLSPISFSPDIKVFEHIKTQTDTWDDEAGTHTVSEQVRMEYDLNARYIDDPDRPIDSNDPELQRIVKDFEYFYIKYIMGIDLEA